MQHVGSRRGVERPLPFGYPYNATQRPTLSLTVSRDELPRLCSRTMQMPDANADAGA